MNAVAFALGGAILWGIADIVTKKLLDKGVSSPTIIFANSLVALLLVLPYLVKGGDQIKEIPLLVLNGLLIVGGIILFYLSAKNGHIAVASAVTSSKVLWTLLFSFLILKSSLSPVSVIGIVLIFTGLVLVNVGE